jgi:hypothetical protein
VSIQPGSGIFVNNNVVSNLMLESIFKDWKNTFRTWRSGIEGSAGLLLLDTGVLGERIF